LVVTKSVIAGEAALGLLVFGIPLLMVDAIVGISIAVIFLMKAEIGMTLVSKRRLTWTLAKGFIIFFPTFIILFSIALRGTRR